MCFIKMPKIDIPQVQTTAREILPSTTSPDPEAPLMGTAKDFDGVGQKKGKDALKIQPDPVVDNAALSKNRGVSGFNFE